MTDKRSNKICDDGKRGLSKSEFQGYETEYVMTDKGSNKICDARQGGP